MTPHTSENVADLRRSQRETSFVKALLNGEPVTLLDVSPGGIGGTMELSGNHAAIPGVGEPAYLEVEPYSPQAMTFLVEIRRLDPDALIFGAQIVEMNDAQFQTLERLSKRFK